MFDCLSQRRTWMAPANVDLPVHQAQQPVDPDTKQRVKRLQAHLLALGATS
jgi:hypothetical protein